MDRITAGRSRDPVRRDKVRRRRHRTPSVRRVQSRTGRGALDDTPRNLRGDRPRTPGGAVMSHVLHVFKKDLRRLRWVIIAWIAVVVARLILKTAGAELSFDAMRRQFVVGNVSELLLFSEILLLALIVSGLVHDEPLVGADAFWLTRPIGARTLLP